MNYWIEYQLNSLEFRNGAPKNARRLGFTNALIEHEPGRRIAAITQLKTPTAEQRRLVDLFAPFELWAIRYKIWVYPKQGAARPVAPAIPYCHPFPKGSGVFLEIAEAGRFTGGRKIFLRQQSGKAFFSDRFKLSDVSDGTIESNQPVYQFLET